MTSLKKLAGQTAIYGVPSIMGRLLNYLLVFLHTDVLKESEYGVYSDLYSYVAFFIVFYTFGMETTFFRFSNKKDPEKVFQQAGSVIFYISTIVSVTLIVFSSLITSWLGYEGNEHFIIWLAIILWIDAIVAIPFAKLRLENKPVRFASYRLANIFIVIFLQIFFLWICPLIYDEQLLVALKPLIDTFYRPEKGVNYIILSNLIANSFFLIFLYRSVVRIGFKIDWKFLKPMAVYGLPILITGLAGIVNERLDIIFLGDFLPEGFYPGKSNADVQGIYSASLKLSILMLLGIQAFRYAAEPFFFSKAVDKNAPELFAKVTRYFIIAGVVVFVGVSLNKEFISVILLRKPEFREALAVVPFLLMGKLLFGIYTNLSIWFKLTDKTIYGTYFSVMGAAITVLGNFLLIPYLGYFAPAYISVLTYLVMTLVCYFYGQKYFPVPYQLKIAFVYIFSGVLVVIMTSMIQLSDPWYDYVLKLTLFIFYSIIIYKVEKRNIDLKTI